MGLLDLIKSMLKGSGSASKGQWQKCPQCSEKINVSMERCPKCGVHISSMFRRKCPKCETLNELENKRCSKCKYDFEAELARASRTFFTCPICGYKSEAYLTACPACNTRFV